MSDFCMEHSAHSRAIKQHDDRLDEHGKEIDQLSECVIKLTTIQEDNAVRLKEIDARLTELENKPAERWDKIVSQIITAVVAFFIGIILSSIKINANIG